MIKYLRRKWDMWIYFKACHTFKRMAESNPGFTYLMELHLREWNKENNISDKLKLATERFHESLTKEER